jgi:hypothetical protein
MPYCKWGPEYWLLVYGDTSEFFSSHSFFSKERLGPIKNLHIFGKKLYTKA